MLRQPLTSNIRLPTEATKTTKSSNTPSSTTHPLSEIISDVNLRCNQQGAFAKCRDEILNIEFDHPITWGEIEAVLRTGDYTGYAYDYFFGGRTIAELRPSWLEGDRDFTVGRTGNRFSTEYEDQWLCF